MIIKKLYRDCGYLEGVFNPDWEDDTYTGWRRNNARSCDMDEGPCSCGAWHSKDEDRVFKAPIYKMTWAVSENIK